MSALSSLIENEEVRCREFPVAASQVFFAHAAVAPLPRVAVQAMQEFLERGSQDSQENEWVWTKVRAAREAVAGLLGGEATEIALLGPTSLGLNLVAHGLPWQDGDEVVYYRDDYPANVYPWTALSTRGVQAVSLEPERPGKITWELVASALSARTKLVALASCSFLSGYRIDVDEIGKGLQERGILFCVDGIQTLGAFPLSVKYVDFLSADSHKWLLGPVGAGVFYVKKSRHELLAPAMLGAWNVVAPHYVAQNEIRFHDGARKYEPGSLNLPGIVGMGASMELLGSIGMEVIGERILELRRFLLDRVRPWGYHAYGEPDDQASAAHSGIVSLTHPDRNIRTLARNLRAANVVISLRRNRAGQEFLRFSPHFYNTHEELERAIEVLAAQSSTA